MNSIEGVNMLTNEQVKQAFVKAIETVGLDYFKRSSLFMMNNRLSKSEGESKAA